MLTGHQCCSQRMMAWNRMQPMGYPAAMDIRNPRKQATLQETHLAASRHQVSIEAPNDAAMHVKKVTLPCCMRMLTSSRSCASHETLCLHRGRATAASPWEERAGGEEHIQAAHIPEAGEHLSYIT